MKRFHIPSVNEPSDPVNPSALDHALLHRDGGEETPYTLFVPLHYEPNYGYPLVIWLHGPGDDERQLQRVMPLVSMRNYGAIAPRGVRTDRQAFAGYSWTQGEADVAAAEQRVFECLATAGQRLHIARQRVFLAGYQCGGTMALRIGLRHPRQFAGVLSLGGPFPIGDSPLAHLDQVRHLPLFLAQGRDSQLYPPEKSCQELRLFHAAGMHVTLRQYPCGDELHARMLHDMDVWLMEQVTGSADDACQWLAPLPEDD